MINLAACLTTGSSLPDGSLIDGIQTVIYQCAEDNSADTIKPRLIAAGADCTKIAFIDDPDGELTLSDSRLEQAIKNLSAKLLILDPLQSFIPQDVDMQSAAKMRAVMRKLAKLAERYQCAIVMIGHMNKNEGGKKLYRGLGSIDIAAIARSVLMITRNTAEPDWTEKMDSSGFENAKNTILKTRNISLLVSWPLRRSFLNHFSGMLTFHRLKL